MNSHLFVAFSGLHLIFAQCICLGLPEQDRKVLWLGSQQGPGSQVDLIQRDLVNPQLWDEIHYIDLNNILTFPGLNKLIRNFFPITKRFRAARKELSLRYDLAKATEVWIPHQFDLLSKTLARDSSKQGKLVHFYEEGLSIYYNKSSLDNGNFSLDPKKILHRTLAESIAKYSGIANPRTSMDEWLDDVWMTMPERTSIFNKSIPHRDLKSFFSAAVLENMLSGSKIGPTLPAAAEAYPDESFILLLGSVEVEDNYFPQKDYESWVMNAIGKIRHRTSLVVYKPHPRGQRDVILSLLDCLKKAGLQVVYPSSTTSVPIEILYPRLNCLFVVGGISSPLVYLRHLYGANTISALAYIDKSTDNPPASSLDVAAIYTDLTYQPETEISLA